MIRHVKARCEYIHIARAQPDGPHADSQTMKATARALAVADNRWRKQGARSYEEFSR